MACVIKTNNQGNIVGVTTMDGKKSELFEAVNSIPFLTDVEQTIDIIKPAYTSQFQNWESNTYKTGEPKLFFRTTNNKEFEDMENAVLKDDPGLTQIGFKDPKTNEFIPVASFDTAATEQSLFIYNQIAQGVLSPKRVLGEDGVNRFQAKGEFPENREVRAQEFKLNAMFDLGIGNVRTLPDGILEVDFPKNTDTVVGIKGENTEVLTLDEIPQKANEYDNQAELRAKYAQDLYVKSYNKPKSKAELMNEAALRRMAYNFLQSLGFTKTRLADYSKNYNKKYGNDPDVKALVDIANRVVAFSERKIPLDELTEEIAHLAIEAYSDQASILEAMVNVVYSPEYAGFSEYYRQKYQDIYSEAELEDAVRKEILGKILAKEFLGRFQKDPSNPTQKSLVDFLRDLWNKLVALISARKSTNSTRILEDLNKRIADSLVSEDFSEFNTDLTGNTNVFFSAQSNRAKTIETQLKLAKRTLEDSFKEFGDRVPRANELDKIESGMDQVETLKSINVIIDIVTNRIARIESNVKEAQAKGEVVNPKDEHVYAAVSEGVLPVLNSIKSELSRLLKAGEYNDNPVNKDLAKTFVKYIEDLNIKKSELDPILDEEKGKRAEEIFSKAYEGSNMSAEQLETERERFKEGNIKDRSIFGYYFGLISHSQNPVLQLIARKVFELRDAVNQLFRDKVNSVSKEFEEKGYRKYQKAHIKLDKDGKKTFYFTGFINWDKYDKAEKNNRIQLISRLTETSPEEVQKLMDQGYTAKQLIKDTVKYKEYQKGVKDWRSTNTEQRFKEQYYKDRDKRFKDVDVAEFTQETISNFNSRRFEILRPYMRQDGSIDKSKLNEGDKRSLSDIRRDKEMAKSALNTFGEIRTGLRVVQLSELTQAEIDQLPYAEYLRNNPDYNRELVVLAEGVSKEDLDEDARISLDMNNMSMYYLQELASKDKTNKPTQAFLDEISKIEAEGTPAYDWVLSNATLVLNEDYYNSLGTYEGFDNLVTEYIGSIEDETERELMSDRYELYAKLNRRRKSLLKQNKRLSNPLEVDVNNMDGKVRMKILELDEEIKQARRSLTQGLPEDFFEGVSQGVSNRDLNEDYYSLLKESGLSDYEFILKHSTKSNYKDITDFAYEISALIRGSKSFIKPRYEEFFQEMLDSKKIDPLSTDEQIIVTLQNEYAKRYAASYFQRYAPEGYEKLMSALKSGDVSMKDLIDKNPIVLSKYEAAQFIEIIPDYSWTEDIANEDYINPNYKKGGYYVKPTEEYLDDEFFNHFGISKDDYLKASDDNLDNFKPTKNQEEYESLKMHIKMREEVLEAYGDTTSVNKWQLVQKSAESFEKIFSSSTVGSAQGFKAAVKDAFSDIVKNKPDDLDYGAQVDGEDARALGTDLNVRVIPKYYQDKLEDPAMITENLFEAGLLDYRQAITYKERKKAEKDIKALEWQITQQRFTNNGGSIKGGKVLKSGATSKYMESAKEYLDHHLYGIQQTMAFKTNVYGKEVDLTRVVNTVQGLARFSNLAYNIFVDITGATTGVLNNAVDRVVGDYYHKSSVNKANSQSLSFMGDYLKEIGKVNKSSKMSALLETFGLTDATYRVQASKYGRAMKLMKRSPHILSKASNMAVTPKILLAMLNDYRFVDGKFLSFNAFKSLRLQDGKAMSDIEAEWSKYENDSLFENMEITENNVKPNKKFKDKFENPDQAFKDLRVELSAKAQQTVQGVDGVLNEVDQAAAQRNFLTNLVMMHRGWLLINMARKFKRSSFNIATGQYEEGHYITAAKAFSELVRGFRSKEGLKGFQAWKDSLPDYQQRNLKRTQVEFSVLVGIMLLGAFVLSGEDDDDLWIEDLGRLIYLRTASEFSSSVGVGIPGSLQEAWKSPVVSLKTFEMLNPLNILGAFKEDDEYGYKGIKSLVKGTVLRRIPAYSDLDKQISAFRYFNDETLMWLGANGFDEKDFIGQSASESQKFK